MFLHVANVLEVSDESTTVPKRVLQDPYGSKGVLEGPEPLRSVQ